MSVRDLRCAPRRLCVASVLAAMVLVGTPGVSGAVPPPPPNPSDDDIHTGQQQVDGAAGAVGRLADQAAQADAELLALQSDLELKREDTNKALIDLHAAQDAAAAAQAAADNARQAAQGAGSRVEDAQRKLDQFAAGSYRQGSTVGSAAAFLGSRNPADLLARAELLDAVGGSQLRVLDDLRLARTLAANRDARARASLEQAHAAQQRAVQAKQVADAAYRAAVDAERQQAGRSAALQARKSDLERRLTAAQSAVAGLRGQRERYQEWVAARDREAVTARSAARTAAGGGSDWGGSTPAGVSSASSASSSVRAVIDRAMSQLGVPYSWGGGDADGPTLGIHDGGVGDSYGDFDHLGFDCSGLMIYAFAQALGYSLPHYSGSQYVAGRQVPLAQRQPGDMLFWGTTGRIHHVALYIGNGQMIEAPYSGSAVRIAPVRYSEIMPYVARLL